MAFKMKYKKGGFPFKDDDDKKKMTPLPPDPDREDGGFETKEELEEWLKKVNKERMDEQQDDDELRGNYDEVD